MTGQTTSHYGIPEKLGRVGMGMICKAGYSTLGSSAQRYWAAHDSHRRWAMRWLAAILLTTFSIPALAQQIDPKIWAVRYGMIEGYLVRDLLPERPGDDRVDVVLVFWVIETGNRLVLFDSGCHRQRWIDQLGITDFVPPDVAIRETGWGPEEVTDIVISHAHFDHMGAIDRFPEATIWIQKDEYAYYSGPAWQEGGRTGGIDPADIRELLERNFAGKVRLVDGDGVDILPGLTVFTGSRHTFASQYLRVGGSEPFILASDNAHLYLNFSERQPGTTFSPDDREANLDQLDRMTDLAGDPARVMPGHDPDLFVRFPTAGRVARIR